MATSRPQSFASSHPSFAIARLLRYRWLVFAVLGLDGALLSFHYVWGATLSGQHAATWGLDAGQLGLLSALGYVPYALMQIPGGYLTSRLGGRRVLTVALVVTAAGTALFALAPTFGVALWGRVVLGVGSAVILLPTLAVLARWFRVREFATVQGGYLLVSAIGSLAATAPLAAAAERWTWRAPLLAVAITTLLGAALTRGAIRDSPADLGLPPITSIDPDASGAEETNEQMTLRDGLRAWRTVPTYWVTSLILFASWGALQAFQGLWAGPLLRHVRGFSTAEAGLALSMFTLGVGFGPILIGWLSDRVLRVRRPIVIAALFGQTVLWAVVALAIDRLPTPMVYLTFLGIAALSGGVLLAQVLVKEQAPPGAFGMIFGIINGAPFYGTAAIQLLTGGLLAAIGPESMAEEPIYGARAYTLALLPVVALMAIATAYSFRLRERVSQQEL